MDVKCGEMSELVRHTWIYFQLVSIKSFCIFLHFACFMQKCELFMQTSEKCAPSLKKEREIERERGRERERERERERGVRDSVTIAFA